MKPIENNVNPIEQLIQSNPTVPTENYWVIDNLPSKCLFYEPGTQIVGRALKTLEVKQLTTIDESNADYIINSIIDKAVKGIKVDDLLVADKLYILFWLRANTYRESGLSVSFNCPSCRAISTYDFTLDCLDIKSCEDDIDYDSELILPASQQTVKFRFKRIKDENKIASFLAKNKNLHTKYDLDILNIAGVISHINGEESNSLFNNYEFLVNLEPVDYAYILSGLEYIDIGVSDRLSVVCNKCGGHTHTGVSFRPDFFIPTYQFK